MLDVGWGDLIDYFGDDPATARIVIYMESIGDARAFLSAAREVALTKPIIVIKAGRSEAASRAAASHTGALTGSDEVLDAAFRRAGVLRVNAIADVFDLAEVLAKQPRPRGRRLTIVTNAGGPGVLATDALIARRRRAGRAVARRRMRRLDAVLPAAWSHGNPIDVLGDADARALRAGARDRGRGSGERRPAGDPHAAGHDRSDADRGGARAATRTSRASRCSPAGWAARSVAAGVDILNRAGIPTFAFPDDAARAFCDMGRYADNLRGALRDAGAAATGDDGQPARACDAIIDAARAEGRTLLDEAEAKAVLATLRHPGRADARRARPRTRPSRRRARSASRSRSSLVARPSRTRPTSAACKLGSARTRPPCARAFDDIRDVGRREGRGGALPRRHRAADGRSQRRATS